MIQTRNAKLSYVELLLRILRIGATMLAGVFITVLVGFVFFMESKPDLSVWHTVELDEEFTTDSSVKSFKEYLALEERLFAELKKKVNDELSFENPYFVNRYNSGSISDPGRWPTNWNRSFEMTGSEIRAGVLLLHGMSDSPYSLRNLAEKLSASGARVLGLRVPGHGTAPAGLVDVTWQDMAAAVKIAMDHLREKVGDRPIYIVGYSNGGALAMQYVLSTLGDESLARVSGVVLISPEIGVTKMAALAVWQARLGRFLGLPKLSWTSVLPEYDPFKYGSFAVNAGEQAHRLTSEIQKQITRFGKAGKLSKLPPIMAFQSVVDTTVKVPALITGLFERLIRNDNELVLFDINQVVLQKGLLSSRPRDLIKSLISRKERNYKLTLITNESPTSKQVVVYQKDPDKREKTVSPLDLRWPEGIYSLSHVALPFPAKDPLYGGESAGDSPGIQLGNMALRGEHGVLLVTPGDLLRLRWNPFYDYMEKRILQFMARPNP